MFENGKQNQLPAAAPDAGAGLRPGGDTRRQWDPSFAWARHLRLVASLHARIPDSELRIVTDEAAEIKAGSSIKNSKEKGRKESSFALSILELSLVGQSGPADLF